MQDQPNHIGPRLGNYRLIRLLGKGGFAEVYLGEHVHLETQAAIKVLHTRLTHNDIEPFRAEARTIARLVHPHIVRVLEFGVEDNIPFLVMDYATGGTMRRQHPQGTILPIKTIVAYVQQLAEALHYAHEQKVIHRDIKPENMLLNQHHRVLLSDFGIAVAVQSQSILDLVPQRTGGTAVYMAPEQIQGKPCLASDQYALGVVVYEWLCGDRPFHGSFSEVCAQHLFTPPPPLSEKIPTISPEVEQVMMIALAKDPARRFGDVLAFARALQRAARVGESSPLISSEAPATNQIEEDLFATVVEEDLFATVIEETPPTVLKVRIAPEEEKECTPVEETQPTVLKEQYSTEEARERPPSTKTEERTSSTELGLSPDRPGKRLGRRTIIAGLAGLASVGTGLTWFVVSRNAHPAISASTPPARASSIGSARFVYEGHTDFVGAVAWSPDGKWIASGGGDATVQVWDAVKGTRIFTYTGHTSSVYTIAWSPDGKRIASGSYDNTVQIWDAFNGGNVFTYRGHGNLVEAVAWSLPDGKKIAVAGGDTMEALNATGGTQIVRYQQGEGATTTVAWSPPRGRWIASGGGTAVYIWNAADGKQITTYDRHTELVNAVAWSPLDGKLVASGAKDTTVQVWKAADGRHVLTYRGHVGYVNAVAWSPDGARIASGSYDNTVQVWRAADGKHTLTYRGDTGSVKAVAWSPDGKWIASGGTGYTVHVWRVL